MVSDLPALLNGQAHNLAVGPFVLSLSVRISGGRTAQPLSRRGFAAVGRLAGPPILQDTRRTSASKQEGK
jgi:hypothetical protein